MRTFFLCVALVACIPVAAAAEQRPEPRTLVTIDGTPITEMHFAVYSNLQATGQAASPQESVAVLNKLVNLAILASQARSEGLADNPEVAAALEIAEIEVLAQAALRNHITTHPITDEELNEAFAARYSSEARTEYKARHILVENEEQARDLIRSLEAGEDFAALAKANSSGPSGPNGGDLGLFEAGQMVAPFSEATQKLDKGQFTKDPVQTQFGWHVILLEDRREADPVALEDVKEQLLAELHRERAAAYMGKARQAVKVEVTPPPQEADQPEEK